MHKHPYVLEPSEENYRKMRRIQNSKKEKHLNDVYIVAKRRTQKDFEKFEKGQNRDKDTILNT